jgi:hypothetical protein
MAQGSTGAETGEASHEKAAPASEDRVKIPRKTLQFIVPSADILLRIIVHSLDFRAAVV